MRWIVSESGLLVRRVKGWSLSSLCFKTKSRLRGPITIVTCKIEDRKRNEGRKIIYKEHDRDNEGRELQDRD